MLFSHSYYSKNTEKEINALAGKPIGFFERLKMKGIGSQRFQVQDANEELLKLVRQQNRPRFTNIELRTLGIIVWFRVKLDNWVLVLPYRELHIIENTDEVILHSGEWNIKLQPAHNAPIDRSFFKKLVKLKQSLMLN